MPLQLVRLPAPKAAQPPEAAPLAGDQMFKCKSLCGHFTFKLQPNRQVARLQTANTPGALIILPGYLT